MSKDSKKSGDIISFNKDEFQFNLDTAFAPFLGLQDEDGDMLPAYYEALINFYMAMEWRYSVDTYSGSTYSDKEVFELQISPNDIASVNLA